jgi:alanine dehydrogenase
MTVRATEPGVDFIRSVEEDKAMIIGVPKETLRHEHRVGLNPFAVLRLTQKGHEVVVQSGAGDGARFSTGDYEEAGARIVYGSDEIYRRADIVARVGALSGPEAEQLKPGSIVCCFHHLAIASREYVERLSRLGATLIGYEIIRNRRGALPVLVPLSTMGGLMAVQVAAHLLQNECGGRGVLLGNIPGVPPPTVLIVGAGTVGRTAARHALATGAHVITLDPDLHKLELLARELPVQAVTAIGALERLERYIPIADVVIGAILIPGARAPLVVTEKMVRAMKPGSVVIDVSIDQGGCVETSRPTTIADPTFVVHDVVHYCVTNMTANVARTASRALANAAYPYIEALAQKGLGRAVAEDPGLAEGVYLYHGRLVHAAAGEALGIPASPLRSADPGGA